MTTDAKMKMLRQKAKALDPMVRIGKNGLTTSVLTQIEKVLSKRELVKVKFLKAFVEENDRKEAAKELAEKLGSVLIEQVGFVVVLYKAKKLTQKTARAQ